MAKPTMLDGVNEKVASIIRDMDCCGLNINGRRAFCDDIESHDPTSVCLCKEIGTASVHATIQALMEVPLPEEASQAAEDAENFTGSLTTRAMHEAEFRAMLAVFLENSSTI